MARYKVTFGFQSGGIGASETYISRDLSASGLGPAVEQLASIRNQLLPANVLWTGIRIGLADGSRFSNFYPPGSYSLAAAGILLTVPEAGDRASGDANNPDQARSTLQMRLTYGGGRSTTRYLAFVPDAVIRLASGIYDPSLSPGWATAFATFRSELINGPWAIRARDRDAALGPADVISWQQSTTAPTNVGVEILATDLPTMTKKDFVRISGVRRRGTDKMTYNGRYKVADINTTLIPDSVVIFLATTEAGDPASVKLPGKLTVERFTYLDIENVFVVRGGTHKRGKPFGTLVGRRSTSVRLDP